MTSTSRASAPWASCPGQARFAALFVALGFPEHKALADAAGVTVHVVSSRMHRLRRRLRLNQLQLVALLTETLRGAGWPGSAFFRPERGVRGTNKEGER